MGILENFNTLITEHGSSAILKERISLIKDQYEQLEKENVALKQRVQELETENLELRNKIPKQTGNKDFIEHRGMFFLRLPNGSIQNEVYCPECRMPMNSLGLMLPYHCNRCDVNASFTGRDLKSVLSEMQ